ncbi:MAG: pectate lyase [Fibrobacteria bacterium]|nr:pectate lyase [Fibrobacteria bacterium]
MIRSTRSFLLATALLGATPSLFATVGSQDDPVPGWASQNGGTTGGKGGMEVTVTNMADLQKYAKMSGKYVIWVKGTVGSYGTRGEGNGDRVVVSSDKSILGLPGAHVKGGFDLKNVKNIILRNLIVEGPGAVDNNGGSAGEGRKDAISIIDGATNIWLDHLRVLDGEDGNTDITKAADFVTVSWTKFTYTDKSYVSGVKDWSHRYCNLLGGSDTDSSKVVKLSSKGRLNVTFYKTWWGEGVAERMPRVRFGKVHVANCLFNSKDPGQGHDIRAAYKADILVDGNLFLGQKKPIDLFDGDFTAITVKSNNVFTNCSGNTAGKGTAFVPPYATLAMSPASALETELTSSTDGAGPTITSWGKAPVPVASVVHQPTNLQRAGEDWTFWNGGARPMEVELLGLDGRHLSSLSIPAGTRATLPRSASARLLRLSGEDVRHTRFVPGL